MKVPGSEPSVQGTKVCPPTAGATNWPSPAYNPDKDKRNFFPMSTLFTYMMMTTAGEAAFCNGPFNNAIRAVLQEWCSFLDSAASRYVLNTGEFGWLSPSAYAYNKHGHGSCLTPCESAITATINRTIAPR